MYTTLILDTNSEGIIFLLDKLEDSSQETKVLCGFTAVKGVKTQVPSPLSNSFHMVMMLEGSRIH